MRNKAFHLLWIVTTISIATTLLVGCPIATKRVLVIGDSISYMSAGDISRVGGNVNDTDPVNRITFTILATPGIGARTTWGAPSDPDEYWSSLVANSMQPGDFDAIIVELGTNDCAYLSASGDSRPDVERIVGAISGADPEAPIFWLTMHEVPAAPDCSSIINGDLRQLIEAGTYPNLMTFDYGTWADAHPECFSDGVHPRERWHEDPNSGGIPWSAPAGYCDGQGQYAIWLKAELDSYFGPPELK